MNKGIVNIIIYGTHSVALDIELFNANKTFALIKDFSINNPGFGMYPITAFSRIAVPNGKSNNIGFDESGGIVAYNGAQTEFIEIATNKGSAPYRYVLEWTKVSPIRIKMIRASFANVAQINQNWTIVKYDVAGQITSHDLDLQNSVSPEQVAAYIIEKEVDILIDGNTALKMNWLPDNNVISSIALSIEY